MKSWYWWVPLGSRRATYSAPTMASANAAGVRFTEPNHVVAGIDPPRPEDVRRIADDILRGAFTGDFAIALERASAFCHVVASGRAEVARGRSELDRAVKLQDMAHDLAENARLWRSGDLT